MKFEKPTLIVLSTEPVSKLAKSHEMASEITSPVWPTNSRILLPLSMSQRTLWIKFASDSSVPTTGLDSHFLVRRSRDDLLVVHEAAAGQEPVEARKFPNQLRPVIRRVPLVQVENGAHIVHSAASDQIARRGEGAGHSPTRAKAYDFDLSESGPGMSSTSIEARRNSPYSPLKCPK